MSKYESYTTCADLWNQSFPSHWNVVPMYAVAKVKSICNSVDLPLLSVYLDAGVVPFESKAEKRTNATSNDLSKYQRVDSGDCPHGRRFPGYDASCAAGSVFVIADIGIDRYNQYSISCCDNRREGFVRRAPV